MIIGTGTLALHSGRRIAVDYQFGSYYGDTRAGCLLCDTSSFDPAELFYPLTLNSDDGTEVVLAVTYHSDGHLGVTGRVLRTPEPAALDQVR